MTYFHQDAEYLLEVFLNAQSDTVVASGKYGGELEYTDWSEDEASVEPEGALIQRSVLPFTTQPTGPGRTVTTKSRWRLTAWW